MIQARRDSTVPDSDAIQAAQNGVAICDRSDWGRIEISDSDRLNFLHNQSTNQIKMLQPGQGCETVVVNSTARTLDLVSVYCQPESILLLVSPNRREQLMQWFDRYIFFQDKVKLTDVSDRTGTFSLIGPNSSAVLTKLGWEVPQETHHHHAVTFQDQSITVAKGSGLVGEGFTLMFDRAIADQLWAKLVEAGAVPMGATTWETLRIEQGRPKADAELTEDFNPLEAGLWHLISFDKGCYIGQETIARLETYDGVKQQLWGLESSGPLKPGEPIAIDEKKVGVVTSVSAEGNRGLGYVKTKAGGKGDRVQIGEAIATLIDVPFLSRGKV